MSKINEVRPLEHPYLKVLECVDDLSKKLYYCGELPGKRIASVAIVGSRKPSTYGREVTLRFAEGLARQGIVIISGLALGVDAIAHQAALDSSGTTVAVQANGLHRLYPASNRQLGERIINSGGAIIGEYEPGVDARPYQFLQRNRIISGLADAVLITEAAARSGSLNTAGHALTQGKFVFAVPGNITSPMSTGCNALLAQGALPATSVDDILAVISPRTTTDAQMPLAIGSTPLEQAIIDALASGLRDGDDLQTTIGCSQSELNTALTMLEIHGVIASLGANQWRLY
ncbi:MAG TPA: DNA-processing protein DprA [Patescibacteria group bacterium]|nr:DNA-processing protein DprA [Patescibacteria group bacterium]